MDYISLTEHYAGIMERLPVVALASLQNERQPTKKIDSLSFYEEKIITLEGFLTHGRR